MPIMQVVMGIILWSSFIVAGASFLSSSGVTEIEFQQDTETFFKSLEEGWSRYRSANRVLSCEHPLENGECAGYQVEDEGTLEDGSGWQERLEPYLIIPSPPTGFDGPFYEETGIGHYFCMEGHANEPKAKALARLESELSQVDLVVNTDCGSTVSSGAGEEGDVAVTAWVNYK